MRAPLMDIFDAVGVRFVQGAVEKIRPDQREVDIISQDGSNTSLPYDRLVLAAGTPQRRSPHPRPRSRT
jgi:NADH dehydrogenase